MQAKKALAGRLTALARAHRLLAKTAWDGAPLAEIIQGELGEISNQVSVTGCDIHINARAAHQFALIVYELATNAFKYGALSVPNGRVSILGKRDRIDGMPMFSFQWTESGGPPVKKPSRKGFGSVILIDSAQHFARHVTANYEPHGLRYLLQVPMQEIGTGPSGMASDVAQVVLDDPVGQQDRAIHPSAQICVAGPGSVSPSLCS